MKKSVVCSAALLALSSIGFSVGANAADDAVLARGKTLFTGAATPIACAVCHTLADAGTTGAIGPNLDELKPAKDVVLKVLKEGMGAMPSFAATLSDEDRLALAEYVVSATGGASN